MFFWIWIDLIDKKTYQNNSQDRSCKCPYQLGLYREPATETGVKRVFLYHKKNK